MDFDFWSALVGAHIVRTTFALGHTNELGAWLMVAAAVGEKQVRGAYLMLQQRQWPVNGEQMSSAANSKLARTCACLWPASGC